MSLSAFLSGLLVGLGQLPLDLVDPDLLEDRDDARRAGRDDVLDVLRDALLVVMLGELADQAADEAADDHRAEQRRCEEADDEAAGDADGGALEDVVVAALLDVHRCRRRHG